MPLFLLDGEHEQKFVQRICGERCVVRRIGCNGKRVAVDAIAKRVATQIRILQNKVIPPFVVCIDLESRSIQHDQLAEQLHEAILGCDGITITSRDLIVGVADQMIENWIIAGNHVAGHPCPDSADGFNGAAWLKQRVDGYHKTTLGVNLLVQARASQIAERSASFARFLEQLAPIISCPWLKN